MRRKAADQLGLSRTYLDLLGRTATFRYRTYKIGKQNGGLRTIHHPAPELKLMQRWIANEIRDQFPIHDCSFAYRRGRGIRDHALFHAGARYLLRIDLRKFFPSLRAIDVDDLLQQNTRNWSSEDIVWASNIICRFGRLAIGAPSSPSISNMLCYKLDESVFEVADSRDIKYSRYADDLYFSSSRPNILKQIEVKVSQMIVSLESPGLLSVNTAKTRHSSRKGRMVVTGLILTQDGGVSIGRTKKRNVRALLHRLGDLDSQEKASLAGYLAFVRSVEPQFINQLYVKYGAASMNDALSASSGGQIDEPSP